MPRADRTKSRLHTSAVSLSKLKGVEPGSLRAEPELPIAEPLSFALDEPSTSRAQKRADFLQAVRSAPHPYLVKSKSHIKREKRKARSNLSTNLTSLSSALDTVLPEVYSQSDSEDEASTQTKTKSKGKGKGDVDAQEERRKVAQRLKQQEREKGMIGEGKGRTLGEKKRRQIIQDGAKRMPAVMAHPAYKSNPWAAIREHVGNTVVSKK